MNARDYASAASLYADDAIYESAVLVSRGHTEGRIVGRERIMGYFKDALAGDEEFQLSTLDRFTGLNMALILSSSEGRTFVDVLRTGDDGLIVEHMEVSPKHSPVDFLATKSKR